MTAIARHVGQRVSGWINRLSRRNTAPATLAYRSIYVLPTRGGLLFALLLFVLWLGAINYGNSMIFAFTFLLASLALVTILHTFRNLRGLKASVLPPEPVFVGEHATFVIQLENTDPRPRTAIGLQYARRLQALTNIPAKSRAELQLQLPAQHRGWLVAPRVRLFTIFPLGLFHAWSYLELDRRCLVYPNPDSSTAPLPAGAGSDGSRPSSKDGQDDFRELRRYRPGDSPRRIAWHVVARGHDPQTKEFAGDALTPVWLDWYQLQALATEARIARLCRWVLDAEAEQRHYGLRLPGLEIPPNQGLQHRDRCLTALALMPA